MVLLQQFECGKMPLAENLQRIRKEKGVKQEKLAEMAGVSLTQISKIERSETDPRVSTIEKLARALSCSTDRLLFDQESEGLTGMLKRSFERADKLETRDKVALIKVINMACAGGLMMQSLDEYNSDDEIMGIEAKLHEEWHNEVDELAYREGEIEQAIKMEEESKKSHP